MSFAIAAAVTNPVKVHTMYRNVGIGEKIRRYRKHREIFESGHAESLNIPDT